MYKQIAPLGDGATFFQAMIDGLHVELESGDKEWAKVPATGPVVVVANHPFGLLEGAALMTKLLAIRPDVKVLANSILATVPEVKDWFIEINPFGGREAVRFNQRGLRQAIEWLKEGRLLVVFPAGEVSHLQWKKLAVTDPDWHSTVARLIRRSGATSVPVYIKGANSALFQILGMLHSKVRTALLPHEFLNKQNRRVEIRVGSPIAAAQAESLKSDEVLTRYLRWRTYLLEHRREEAPAKARPAAPVVIRRSRPAASVEGEVAALPESQFLAQSGDQQVYVASSRQIPRLLDEIGTLREAAFRAVGEGTGSDKDLDEFDGHYRHLFSWSRKNQEVIGAYRLGLTDEILMGHGVRGLYTSTLFNYHRDFLREVEPAIELGRSFVRPEYQKSFASLLVLWKGIGQFIVRNPHYRMLFGPVSISNDYSPVSRQLMVHYLRTRQSDARLSRLVKPRQPFRTWPFGPKLDWSVELEELSAIIADIERDGKGVPVLLRQYLKLGGRLAAFNVDPKFSRCLDGLIVVDLAQTDRTMLERYMGADGADSFLNFHRELVA
ncbi:MAG: GNAT family N-acetyltransferase [Acidobacteria bacterium]|nr:GNAT family N-acetyltransferase [Acidobacteriota bacterium]